MLNDCKVDEREFGMLQTFHLSALNELANVDHRMEAETRAHFKKSTGRDQQSKESHKQCLMMCALFPMCYFICYHSTKNG